MKRYGNLYVRCGALLGLILATAGCHSMNHTQRGALLGTGLGAATGAIVGHQSGHRDKGALLGAAVGGIGGALLGNAKDAEDERNATIDYHHRREHDRQARQRAVTNADVMDMTRHGVSDAVIISTIHDRGGLFDTSPTAIVQLSEYRVSDAVIQAMQNCNRER